MEQTVKVNLGKRSYTISIGAGNLARIGTQAASMERARNAVVVSDARVAALYGRQVADALSAAGLAASLLSFPAGEVHKTLATVSALMDGLFAVQPPVDRSTLVIALGGGVSGDVAGFVAATALRGLRYLQCPTTLLAAVDSSIGGKTGVDHPAGKNLIGAFHQPSAVVVDVRTLKTLPVEELRNGLAECVKHAVIRDLSLLDFIETHADALLACDEQLMATLIARNVTIKAAVVSADEREAGQRAHLNFGHTIGHAIETLGGYGAMGHGHAVSLGMAAACHLAARRNLSDAAIGRRVEGLLRRLGLPVRHAGLDGKKIWQLMQHDKKALGGKVRMVLPTGDGRVELFDDIAEAEVLHAVEYLKKR